MKEHWQKIALKIDALSLRERAMAFAIAALVLVALINTLIINPQFSRQQQLSRQVKLDQQQITAMQEEIRLRVSSHDIDPDAPNRLRLQQLMQQSAQMRDDLTGMQKGLVSPDRMAGLLEDLLKRDGRLRLKSLKTLPASLLSEPLEPAAATVTAASAVPPPRLAEKDKAASSMPTESVYKHGVEIVVEGTYADITHYLAQLEQMPWQLFWAKARLDVDAYPTTRLTLILFTLSLDKKWLNI